MHIAEYIQYVRSHTCTHTRKKTIAHTLKDTCTARPYEQTILLLDLLLVDL